MLRLIARSISSWNEIHHHHHHPVLIGCTPSFPTCGCLLWLFTSRIQSLNYIVVIIIDTPLHLVSRLTCCCILQHVRSSVS